MRRLPGGAPIRYTLISFLQPVHDEGTSEVQFSQDLYRGIDHLGVRHAHDFVRRHGGVEKQPDEVEG